MKRRSDAPPLLRSVARFNVITEHGSPSFAFGVTLQKRRFIESLAPLFCSRRSRSVMKSTTKTPE